MIPLFKNKKPLSANMSVEEITALSKHIYVAKTLYSNGDDGKPVAVLLACRKHKLAIWVEAKHLVAGGIAGVAIQELANAPANSYGALVS